MLTLVEDFLEMMVTHAQHHVGIHGDETAIGIVGEARVAGLLRQRYQGFVVEAEVEHRIHHPGHGCARAGAHRHEQWIFAVAECLAGEAADSGKRSGHLFPQVCWIGLPIVVIVSADRGGDSKAGRHRQTEIGHFGKPRALAAEKVAHVGATFRRAVAEAVDPLRLA
jgi:hypothetical protein